MKTKLLSKKLRLNKETIIHLTESSMKEIMGGENNPKSFRITGCTCPTGSFPCC